MQSCTIIYDLLFLTLERGGFFQISYIMKCQSQITHSAPEKLCTQSPPLSLSQIFELEDEGDEPSCSQRLEYIKTTFEDC